MTRASTLVALWAAVAGMGGACSTTYQPRSSGRVALVIHHGVALYVKDGQEIPIGPLGGALEPLLESSPSGAFRARRAYHQLAFGVPFYLAGVAALVIGLASARPPLRWGLIGAGAATGGTGLGLIGAGITNGIDAVNIYNDSVSPPATAP